jgi:hypothetical protein
MIQSTNIVRMDRSAIGLGNNYLCSDASLDLLISAQLKPLRLSEPDRLFVCVVLLFATFSAACAATLSSEESFVFRS